MNRWGEKRYHSMDYDLKRVYGEKVYKITLNGGMTCPNRDGTLGFNGCIFCSAKGSGDFAGSWLEALYTEALKDPDVKILSIATRPDCLGPSVLTLLERINRTRPVWVELGLQTIHPGTAAFIRRGYELPVFEQAVQNLRAIGITVIVHTILYLPGETQEQMLETLEYLNHMDIQGIKLQLLHILRDTDLAVIYENQPFHVPDMAEYIQFLGTCISRLNPQIAIHRLTGDGPKELLAAPMWTQNKRTVLNALQHYLKEQDIWQGKEYHD